MPVVLWIKPVVSSQKDFVTTYQIEMLCSRVHGLIVEEEVVKIVVQLSEAKVKDTVANHGLCIENSF